MKFKPGDPTRRAFFHVEAASAAVVVRRVRTASATCHLPRSTSRRHRSFMDKLEEIFSMQDALNRRIGVNLPPPTDEEKAKWILNYTRAMQQETAELIDSVPWKWWAKYQKFDEQNAKVEVVDLFHFLVSLAQTLGMTADDVYQAYLKKNAVNHQRQETGYAKKDEADSKHI
jgi:dimeric dUTPase (all-alpha-NTP-PPase superfamily)